MAALATVVDVLRDRVGELEREVATLHAILGGRTELPNQIRDLEKSVYWMRAELTIYRILLTGCFVYMYMTWAS